MSREWWMDALLPISPSSFSLLSFGNSLLYKRPLLAIWSISFFFFDIPSSILHHNNFRAPSQVVLTTMLCCACIARLRFECNLPLPLPLWMCNQCMTTTSRQLQPSNLVCLHFLPFTDRWANESLAVGGLPLVCIRQPASPSLLLASLFNFLKSAALPVVFFIIRPTITAIQQRTKF